MENWLRQEMGPAYDALKADPARAVTVDQVRARLAAGHKRGTTKVVMQNTVIFTPEAQEQLAALYRYIAAAASPEIAERYTSAIVTYCEGLQPMNERMSGNRRNSGWNA